MDIKIVLDKMNQMIQDPNNNTKYQAFVGAYTMLLDSVKITKDTVDIALDSVDIDKGVNFLDTFAALDKNKIQATWKLIRNNEKFKANANYKSLKLMCAFAASGIGGDINTRFILGNILTAMVACVRMPKQNSIEEEVYPIIIDEFVDVLPNDIVYPEWEKIKITPESIKILCECFDRVIKIKETKDELKSLPIVPGLKKWCLKGKEYAEEKIELKEREKNIPPKKSSELTQLFEHFKSVEEALDKSVRETTSLIIENRKLTSLLNDLSAECKQKETTIKGLEKRNSELEVEIGQANQEVDERKKLNDAQVQYREDSRVSLLQDIARALKAEYGDFEETKNVPMNEMLGEIYREKLKKIFKILEQKGVKVNTNG